MKRDSVYLEQKFTHHNIEITKGNIKTHRLMGNAEA